MNDSELSVPNESADLKTAILAMNLIVTAVDSANELQSEAPLRTPLVQAATDSLIAMFRALERRMNKQE